MNEQTAIEILVQVANLAQSRGVLSLDDATTVKQAVDVAKAMFEDVKEDSTEQQA